MGVLERLKMKGETSSLKTTEEVDELFDELKLKHRPIDKELDLKIRMSMQKLKLQKYYESKLKEGNIKIAATSPKANANQNNSINKIASTYFANQEKAVKKKKKKKHKLVPEVSLTPAKPAKPITQPKQSLFNNLRKIDILIKFVKENKDDFNAVIEKWIRNSISNNNLLEYYKGRMSKEMPNYRSIVDRMFNVNVGRLNDRMQMRIDSFSNRLIKRMSQSEGSSNNMMLKTIAGDNNTSFDITKEKVWILDWNCVVFRRGSVVIFARSDLNVKFKPTEIYVPKSLESFNYLRNYLNARLEPVRCVIRSQSLTVVDKINFDNAILMFAAAARQRVINVNKGAATKITPMKMSFNQAVSEGRKMTPEDFKKYKSLYIDYLVKMQGDNYKVVPCAERLAHANSDTVEFSFIFTLDSKPDMVLIVHENVNIDRSTLLFLVKKDDYDKTIRGIYDFLQSAEINKRSGIRDRAMEIKGTGIIRYKSINHDELYSWKNAVRMFAKYGY